MTKGEKFNWRFTAVWWLFLFAAAMYLMIVTATNKTIVIADSSNGAQTAGAENLALRQELALEATAGDPGVFLIPLESNTKAGNVVVENSYLDRELRIFIGGAQEQFYAQHAVWGDVEPILRADRETQRDGVLIRLQLNSVYEFQTSMEGDMLKIKANKPKELYSMVVVVDPAECVQFASVAEGNNQEELTLAVSRLLTDQWNVEGVKLYFTRTMDRSASDGERIDLTEAVDADLYIRLDTAQDADASMYGIRGRYNEEYFIPGFGNVELADILTRNVTIAAGNRAVGVAGTEQDSILNQLQIPAASIEMGYLSNPQESMLMNQDGYRQKLATGVMEAVREVYTNYYEQNIQ